MPIRKRKSKTKKRKLSKDPLDSTMSLGDHLEELRSRLFYALAGIVVCTIICFCLGTKIISFIEMPYINVMGEEARLQTLAPADGFISYMKISLVGGLVVSSPWVFYHLWMFVATGLYSNERRYINMAIPFSATLFVTGALFFIFVVAPITLGFFVKFNQRMLDVSSNFTFQKYISFVSTLMLVFGIAFQTPVAIFFLNKTGLVSIQALRSSRKFVLLGIFVVAAFVTPPDVVSQITLALPLYLLFELGIAISYIAGRKSRL